MKKRLLITSIVMMLVVAVALSTATYAWFTSNARVDAASLTLRADTSSATALGIGWAGGDSSTSISANVSGVLAPMAPVALTNSTTAGGGASDIAFYTQTTKQENSKIVFNGVGTGATPITYTNGSATAFYVKNLSNANTIGSITVTAVFAADGEVLTGKAYSYAPIMSKSIAVNATYYTRSGSAPSYVYTPHSVSGEALANANFEAASGKAAASVTYYSQEGEGDYTPVDASDLVVGEADVDSYYTMKEIPVQFEVTETVVSAKDGDDMIRVAIFRKGVTGSGTAKEYTYGDYTLIGVLGSAATEYSLVTGSYDLNTTYYVATYAQVAEGFDEEDFVTDGTLFTRSGEENAYIYTQINQYTYTVDNTVTSENFEGKKASLYVEGANGYESVAEGTWSVQATYYTREANVWDDNETYYTATSYAQNPLTAEQFATAKANGTVYTAENTAVFGSITANGEVKNLSHYEISTSLELLNGTDDLGTLKQVDIMAIVWLDGTVFDDSRAGDIGSVSLKFDA